MANQQAILDRKAQELGEKAAIYKIPISDEVAIEVKLDDAVVKKTQRNFEAMLAARQIPQSSNVSKTHPLVVEYAKYFMESRGKTNSETAKNVPAWLVKGIADTGLDKPTAILEEAVEAVQKLIEIWMQITHGEAMLLAIIGEGTLIIGEGDTAQRLPRGFFKSVKQSGYVVWGVHDSIPIANIPDDYFSPAEDVAERLKAGLPAKYRINPLLPQEQQLANLEAVKNANTEFSQRMNTLLQDYFENAVDILLESEDEFDTDEDGFHSGDVDGNMDAQTPGENKNGRGRRANNQSL